MNRYVPLSNLETLDWQEDNNPGTSKLAQTEANPSPNTGIGQQQFPHVTGISVLSWNVAGLESSISNPDWQSLV